MKMTVKVALTAMGLCVLCSAGWASDLYWDGTDTTGDADGGAGSWDNGTTANWDDAATGGNSVTWANAAPDSAFFGGAVGTVTLGEDISIKHMRFTASANNYTVAGNTLNFAAGGTITQAYKNVKHTITSAITGRPNVSVINGTGYEGLTFAPSAGTVELGTLKIPYDDPVGGDKAGIRLGGSTSGNSVTAVQYEGGDRYGALYIQDSGIWSVGDINVGIVYINGGGLIATGTVTTQYQGLFVNGGVLHYNNAGVIQSGGFSLNNGSLDNSSGAAITTSTYNPAQTWGGNWTFIGSSGANSDLNLGTGAVTLSGSRTVTVSNSASTLTVGGVIDDGASVNSLAKIGAGKLVLAASNTYDGATYVYEGTLSNAHACLSDTAVLSVSNNATVELGYTGTDTVLGIYFDGVLAAAGTWGSPSSGADNTTNVLSGTGILAHNSGVLPAGIWYWDGPNSGGTGDALSDGGSGTWSTSVDNWDQGYVSRKVWNNTTADKAIFGTSAGTVDLQSDITLGEILIETVDNYTIGSNPETQVLNFGGVGEIRVDGVTATIRAGITGSPDIHTPNGFREKLYLRPDSVDMAIGDIYIGVGSSSNPEMHLLGSTTGNTVNSVPAAHSWAFLTKDGSSKWTVGDVTCRELRLYNGTFVINGTMSNYGAINWTGGTLAGTGIVNEVVTVPAGGTLAPGDTTGTLTVTNNNCTINGTLDIEVNGAAYSVLSVDAGNTLTISSATLDVNVISPPSNPITVALAGTVTGQFAATNNLPADWVVIYDGSSVVLDPPPSGTLFLFH